MFICSIQNKLLPLHPQFPAGDVCTSSAWVADIFKRRLLALCSDLMKCRKFQINVSELSNDRCPTGYRLSLLCLLVRLLHIHICAHAYLNYKVARECICIRRGLRVVSSNIKAMRQPHKVELAKWQVPRFFLYPIKMTYYKI